MSALEPRIEAVRAKYGLSVDDFWKIKQNGQWVCKHAALEIVAVKAGIEWLPPHIIEANAPALVTSMIVTGKMGERVEWATGETNQTNYHVVGKQPAYPWAMSEKRAKDRVVLKLVGIHGLVYSEDEADDFKDSRPAQAEAKSSAQLKRNGEWEKIMADLESDLVDVKSMAGLDNLRKQYLDQAERDGWTAAWRAALLDRLEGCEGDIRKQSLWEEMINISTLGGLQSFWEENLPSIKGIGSKAVADFTAKKDEMKNAFLARQSTLAAG